ncbi:diphosphomevalonate decarboxylase [Auritidibacter ignavus]|uniref:diphosphomevalonate decarboxylase n=1 Tax=Auritidibacter ignavus TaxID=678932 RepID=A0AAJ6DCI8_9MICC|nr:diphosphomevalonate decarboxylase [Auritidibacter ignavus]WGH92877.1 diphosphomevalonate decarboxylase [Auritidibacter ignavus]
MSHAIAQAHPNIALVKYWGKADEQLMIPLAGSLSMTLDDFATTTRVELLGCANSSADNLDTDLFELNGAPQTGSNAQKISAFLDLVRTLAAEAGLDTATARARVTSCNEGPTAAGMASSASGFAALATAAATAYGLSLDTAQLSRLARRGSGSACRSVIDRFAVWHAGTDDATSYATAIQAPDMRMTAVTISGTQKKVSSREGMRRTLSTSPFVAGWAPTTEAVLKQMMAACAAEDFTTIGELTELHAHRMHALINSANPPIRYLAPDSWRVIEAVTGLREAGTECYATADAGPNVVIISRPEDAETVVARMHELLPQAGVKTFAPGPGARLVEAP